MSHVQRKEENINEKKSISIVIAIQISVSIICHIAKVLIRPIKILFTPDLFIILFLSSENY